MSIVGLGCASAQVTGSLQVTGTWTAKTDGRYSDNTTTSGGERMTLPASCLQLSGTTITCERISGVVLSALGYSSLSCSSISSGGCTCPATVKQTGWMGWVSLDASTSGTYKTSGNVITLDDEAKYAYCVSGNKMTWTPQSTTPTVTGTIVLQKPASGP
jgi:hypothetical protein